MKPIAMLCYLGTISLLIMAILMGANLLVFIDPPSMLVGPFAATLLLVATYGVSDLATAYGAGFRGLFGSDDGPPDPAKAQLVVAVGRSGILYSWLTALAGFMIGHVQMLANLEDPSAIGPAMAVSLLTGFYAVLAVMFVYLPMTRNAEAKAA